MDTYYIYDDFGQLRAVFPPLLSAALFTDGVAFSSTDLKTINELAFLYTYDDQGRMVGKKVPGAKAVTMVYDAQDRLSSSTDGKGQVINYTYDTLNRVIQTAVGGEWLTKTYYDGTNPDWEKTATSDYALDKTAKIGMVTGGETRRIDEANTYGDPIVSRIYYDSRYRPVKTYKNFGTLITGGMVEEVMTKRSYIGTVQEEKTVQSTGMDNFTILKTYQYDHAERLLSICHRITELASMKTREEVPHLLNWLTYDGLGRLSRKSVGKLPLKYLKKNPDNDFAETQYFDYNIRNALTKSNGYRLLYKKSYDKPEVGKQNFNIELSYTADKQFNGNIGKYTWNVNGDKGGFNLVYDGMNRLLSAKDAGAYWDEELAYDRNGNISNLKRWRKAASQELVDDLTYTYANGGKSNQLLSVSDATSSDVGYNNRNASGNDFTYDDNGNITKDSDKGLSEIGYNVLNLVSQIKKAGVMTQSYIWDGAGTKLKYFGGGLINKVYIGGVEYTKNTNNAVTPSRLEIEEGFVGLRENWTESSLLTKYVYYYTLKDHLGNIRIVMNDDQDAEVVQSNSYSAFGLLALGPNAGALKYNSCFYNGKEKQEDTGWLDYGARMYIPESGRWLTLDPSHEDGGQESTTPYGYVFDDPINHTDPDGRFPVDWKAAGSGFVKGVVIGAVGAVAVTALIASGGTAAPLIGYGLAAYGAYETGKAGYEVASGKEAYSGRQLNDSERSEKAGGLVGGFVGGGLGAKSGLGGKIASKIEGPVVYRGLAEGENPAQGLSARSPGNGTKPVSHVAGKKQSDLISTTKDESVALGKYNSGNGVVKIRLNKVKTEIIDVSGGIEKGGRMSNWAKRDQEVLIRDNVPANAISVIQKPQK